MKHVGGKIAYVWGIGGIALAVIDALIRLAPIAVDAFRQPLGATHWVFLAVWMVFMVIVEGVRGFHRSFSPRVVARAEHLLEHARPVDVVLAPFFCSSLYGTTRRRLIAGWGMVAGIVSVIVAVRLLAQPWRGLIDAGVVAGLSVGLLSIAVWFVRARRGYDLPFGPELSDRRRGDMAAAGVDLSRAPTS